jgi:hypothetical protein
MQTIPPLSLSTPATLPRSRLLLPNPQCNQINARQVTEGLNRYNAGVIEFTKRLEGGFGGWFNYTYSVMKDNQLGETNFCSYVNPQLAMHYNYISSMPACAAGQDFTTACYNPLSEYGYGMLDVPYRLNIAPIFELPFGNGKRWATGRAGDLLTGGWIVSAAMSIQSGFPDQRATGRRFAPRRSELEPAEHCPRCGSRNERQLRRAARVGRSSDGDVGESAGVSARAGRHVRQRAADDYRCAPAAAGERGPVDHQGRSARRHQAGPVQAGSHQPAESSEYPHAANGKHLRQLQLWEDEHTSRFHKVPAVHVQVQLLAFRLRASDFRYASGSELNQPEPVALKSGA